MSNLSVVRMAEVEPFYDECGPVRAVWHNNKASLARLTMNVGASTKAHYHKVMTEVYVIEKGQGKLFLDDEDTDVSAGDLIEISVGVEHRLFNTGDEELELSVLCTPPFDPTDIYFR